MTPRIAIELSDSMIERMLHERAAAAAPSGLSASIVALAVATPQRRRLGLWPRRGAGRPDRVILALVAAALVLVEIALAIAGSGRDVSTTIDGRTPSPSTATPPEPSQSAPPSAPAVSEDLVAFVQSIRNGTPDATEQLWVARLDGTEAHPLLPEMTGDLGLGGWSPDGEQFVFTHGTFGAVDDRLYLTDSAGTTADPVDTGCVARCTSESGPTFSRDGQRILFIRHFGALSVVAWVDLATGDVTELEATRMEDISSAEWSPDGTEIAFAVYRIGEVEGTDTAATYVVAADGGGLHVVSPSTLRAYDPRWAPDGTTILVTIATTTIDGLDRRDTYDLALVRPDGSGFTPLTTEGRSGLPSWLPDGRIRFARLTIDGFGAILTWEWWAMDADGQNPTPFDLPPILGDQLVTAWPVNP
jgi:dipeptidyl aminopeptidase/acylaminoacyl peptidase